jgi:hypothetical protein
VCVVPGTNDCAYSPGKASSEVLHCLRCGCFTASTCACMLSYQLALSLFKHFFNTLNTDIC